WPPAGKRPRRRTRFRSHRIRRSHIGSSWYSSFPRCPRARCTHPSRHPRRSRYPERTQPREERGARPTRTPKGSWRAGAARIGRHMTDLLRRTRRNVPAHARSGIDRITAEGRVVHVELERTAGPVVAEYGEVRDGARARANSLDSPCIALHDVEV